MDQSFVNRINHLSKKQLVVLAAKLKEKLDSSAGRTSSVGNALHEILWRPLERAETQQSSTTLPPSWLVVGSEAQLPWLSALRESVTSVSVVPSEGDALEVLRRLTKGGERHVGLVFAPLLDSKCSPGGAAVEARVEQSCVALLALLQELAASGAKACVVALTHGAVAISDAEHVDPSQLPMTALLRTAALEVPQLHACHVDTDRTAESDAWLASQLSELTRRDQLALRCGAASAPILERLEGASESLTLKEDATYLITGGLGGLGLLVAEHLVELGARHLVLTGRSGVRSEVQNEAVAALEGAGCSVRVVAADVGVEEDVARIAAVLTELPKLAGVLHAAGVLADGTLLRQTPAQLSTALAPKVRGTLNLTAHFAAPELDFFVLFSSVAPVFGSSGQANYAAANAFLDGTAHALRREGVRASSVNWGPWGEVGMATSDSAKQKFERVGALRPLTNRTGLAILDEALRGAKAQLVAVAFHEPALFKELSARASIPALFSGHAARMPRVEAASQTGELVKKLEGCAASERRGIVAAFVVTQIREVLGLARERELDLDEPLEKRGLDSLMSVELRNRLARGVDRALPVSLLFDHPTPNALVSYFIDLLRDTQRTRPEGARDRAATLGAQGREIAIVGLSCRLPGDISDLDSLAERLMSGVDCVEDLGDKRWDADRFYDADPNAKGKMYVRRAGLVSGVDGFDHQFFAVSPREAECMDPQQRLVLEACWEALENAGCDPTTLHGRHGGVFIGPGPNTYQQVIPGDYSSIEGHMGTGSAISIIAGRVAYQLGLEGPTLAVDTACSSSLVAIHLAAESLLRGECEFALAGGVNLLLSPETHIVLSAGKMLSPDGKCKTFDASADGYVRSEGCAIVVLKRLADAQAAGDRILGIVHATGINQDGRSQGLTAPNGRAQQQLIRTVLAKAGLSASDIDFVETHGTGTALGDPIEVESIRRTYGEGHDAAYPLYLGSIKSNIGHAESAAGVAGLLKILASFRLDNIPPNLHFREPNPHLGLSAAEGLVVVDKPIRWQRKAKPRLSGLSSFGFSGTNAHAIIGEPPVTESTTTRVAWPVRLLVASAKTSAALRALLTRYAARLATLDDAAFDDFCFTAALTRSRHSQRVAIVARDASEARRAIAALLTDEATWQREVVTAQSLDGELSLVWPIAESSDALPSGLHIPSLAAQIRASSLHNGSANGAASRFSHQLGYARWLLELGIAPTSLRAEGMQRVVAAALAEAVRADDVQQALAVGQDPREAGLAVAAPQIRLSGLAQDDFAAGLPAWLRGESSSEVARAQGANIDALPSGGFEPRAMIEHVKAIYLAGIDLDWASFYRDAGMRKVEIPGYPFQHQRFWSNASESALVGAAREPRAALVGERVALGSDGSVVYRSTFQGSRPFRLADHRLHGTTVVPGAAHIALLVELGRRELGEEGVALDNVVFSRPMVLPNDSEARQVQYHLAPVEGGACRVVGTSAAIEGARPEFTRHIDATLVQVREAEPQALDLTALRARLPGTLDGAAFYRKMWDAGYHLAGTFRWVQAFHYGQGECLARLSLPAELSKDHGFHVPPSLIDACFQSTALCVEEHFFAENGDIYIPFAVDEVRIYRAPSESVWVRCVLESFDPAAAETVRLRVEVYDPIGRPILTFRGLSTKRAEKSKLLGQGERDQPYLYAPTLQTFVPPRAAKAAPGREVLVLLDRAGLGRRLGASLEKSGVRCRYVAPAHDTRADVAAAWEALSAAGNRARELVVLNFWPTDAHAEGHTDDARIAELFERELLLAQRLQREDVVLRGFCSVTLGAQLHAGKASQPLSMQAAVWGFQRTLMQENPQQHGTLLDLSEAADLDLPALVDAVLELPAGEQLCVRDGALSVVRLAAAPTSAATPRMPSADAAYLITGGLGGLGLEFADCLVKAGARCLFLVGRSAPSERAERALAQLRAKGAEIRVVRADVSDAAEVRRLLAEIAAHGRPLKGVIHAAGAIRDGVIADQSISEFVSVFGAKARAALLLHEQTRHMDLELFVLCSSMAAFGSSGQGNYAAANAYLDALAHHRHALGLCATSINWGPWAEVGMAAEAQAKAVLFGPGELIPLETGKRIFERLAFAPALQMAVIPPELIRKVAERAEASLPFYAPLTMRTGAKQAGPNPLLAELSELAVGERFDVLVHEIKKLAAKALKIASADSIDEEESLQDLGLDSLLAIEIRNALGMFVGATLPATLVFNYPSVRALTEYILREHVADVPQPSLEPARTSVPSQTAEKSAAEGGLDVLADALEARIQRLLSASVVQPSNEA